ncbi:hypothetical protein E2A64_10280 [Pseudohoeflea suaedae]|uniref:AP2/ERF domain-containing protein n=1 Tax=Pseudohoeflea suaedae TaxID=877384 RepID=A0A4R5PKH3_9HYPH|nr:GIY-YIG nuclease family protein [Pseudohoeflea suaedae]TDH35714.1 hypothetical protein E2A64_10280 [Pseudohoeflea suaedae]
MEQQQKSWVVYTLSDSRNQQAIRYVGITADAAKRIREHRRPRASDVSRRAKWLRSVVRAGGQVFMSVSSVVNSSEAAEAEEIRLIAELLASGADLVNGTAGGGGLLNPTAEVRDRISKASRATRTPAFRARLSKIMSAKVTTESMAALSLSIAAGKSSPEAKIRDKVAKRMKPPLSNNAGPYKGVSLYKASGKWGGRIKLNGVQRHLGIFPTPEAAARAYDQAAYAAWGKDCYLNFPADLAA